MTPDPDAGLADRIAAALRQERQRELKASINPPPPRPVAPVPDWLFGPRHRELDAERSRDGARPCCPTCGQALPQDVPR